MPSDLQAARAGDLDFLCSSLSLSLSLSVCVSLPLRVRFGLSLNLFKRFEVDTLEPNRAEPNRLLVLSDFSLHICLVPLSWS